MSRSFFILIGVLTLFVVAWMNWGKGALQFSQSSVDPNLLDGIWTGAGTTCKRHFNEKELNSMSKGNIDQSRVRGTLEINGTDYTVTMKSGKNCKPNDISSDTRSNPDDFKFCDGLSQTVGTVVVDGQYVAFTAVNVNASPNVGVVTRATLGDEGKKIKFVKRADGVLIIEEPDKGCVNGVMLFYYVGFNQS